MKNFINKHSVLLYNPILVYFFILMGISLISIASSLPMALWQYPDSNFVMRQLMFFIIGGIALITVLIVGMERLRALRWGLYGFFLFLLLLLYLDRFINIPFAVNVNNATRWINLGFMNLQPSEFMRIILILCTADIIQKHNSTYKRRTSKSDLMLIGKVLLLIAPPVVLIFRQPDSGITILILITAAVMLLAGGVQWRYILTVGGIGIIGTMGFLTIARYYPEFLIEVIGIKPYQISRFSGWFDPFGTVSGYGFQLARGLSAIGSGGLFGHGFQSDTVFFPEAHTDFIFAVIGMDFGLFGTMAVVAVSMLFNFEILNTAALNRGRYNSEVCVGIFASLIGQQLWNIGMCIGMLPISGVTLPFISHGGSSVLASMILLGIILSAFVEGAKIKHTDSNYKERILYLKTKGYLKEDSKGLSHRVLGPK